MSKMQIINIQTQTAQAREMEAGDVFRTVGYDGEDWYMRVNAAGFIAKGSAIKNIEERDDILVVQLPAGIVHYLKGDTKVRQSRKSEFKVLV
jgi:hypothetical protein